MHGLQDRGAHGLVKRLLADSESGLEAQLVREGRTISRPGMIRSSALQKLSALYPCTATRMDMPVTCSLHAIGCGP